MSSRSSRLGKALEKFRAGDICNSKKLAEKLLQIDKNNAEAYHLLCLIAHSNGDLVDSLRLVQRATSINPNNAAYLNTEGFILRLLGRYGEAIQRLKTAINLKPDYADAFNNLGIVYADSDKIIDAEKNYREALKLRPDFPEVLNNLGNVLVRLGKRKDALAAYSKAILKKPDYAEAYSNLGDTFASQNDHEEALKNFQRAVEITPKWADAWYKSGNCSFRLEEIDQAVRFYRCCLDINPSHMRCLSNIGAAYEKLGRYEEAAIMLRQALIHSPENSINLQKLGHVLLKLGQPMEAALLLTKATQIAPTDSDAHYTLGNALLRMEKLEDAMKCYKRVRHLQPSAARGVFAPASVLLLNGQYDAGWAAYESRFGMSAFKPNIKDVHARLWDGSPLNGRDLLVHVEQGFGDTIQFIRYVPRIAMEKLGTGGKIKLLCEPELYPVIKSVQGYHEIYQLNGVDKVIFDVQIPLLSLPSRFRTNLDTIPSEIPYLKAPSVKSGPVVFSHSDNLNVGIAWAGRSTHSDDRYRSIPFKYFFELLTLSDIDLYSIQTGPASLAAEACFANGTIVDLKDKLGNFGETAAVIEQLDLVITCDTAVAHLAGALGKPVWVLLPYGGEWRWLVKREDSPWYPTMRLFRQVICGDWQNVFERVKNALSNLDFQNLNNLK